MRRVLDGGLEALMAYATTQTERSICLILQRAYRLQEDGESAKTLGRWWAVLIGRAQREKGFRLERVVFHQGWFLTHFQSRDRRSPCFT